MGGFKGIFGRNAPQDWLEKLRNDYGRVCEDPANRDAATDFFQTSEYLVDWLYPDNRAAREKLREEPLLQICSHLANQTKHYVAKAKHHTSVSGAEFEESAFQGGAFQSDAFQVGGLEVRLKGIAAEKFGPSIEARDLAGRLLKFWEERLSRR